MISKFVFICIALISIETSRCDNEIDPLVVEISNGLVKGKDNGNFYSWESIPYAEAPIGNLRFEAPQPYQTKWTEVYDASLPPEYCMQWDQFKEGDNKLHGVEDCLRVNIYRPKTIDNKQEKLPVLIFIHGGCFMFGGPQKFEPDVLMAAGGVILVKISYRVGPLGFLSTADENITGNFGLKDQQMAIQWIKDNIAKFMGDPDKILLSGYSAGGASTHLQMLNPWLKDKVNAVASLSGVALDPWVVIRNPKENALKLANLVNCSTSDNTLELKNCLKQQKAENIVTAVKNFQNFGYNPFTTFGPVVESTTGPDEAFMTEHPRDIIKSGNFSQLPWLTAYAAQDGAYNAAELLQINPKTGKEFIYDLNDKWLELAPKNLFLQNIKEDAQEYAHQLRVKYLGNLTFSVENYLKVQELYTDVLFRNGALESLKLHGQNSQHSPVYGYVYSNPPDFGTGYLLSQRKDIEFGTNHGDDLALVLPMAFQGPPRLDENIISRKLINMLIDFVETDKLTYDTCAFENNAGIKGDRIKLTLIKRDTCEIIEENVEAE